MRPNLLQWQWDGYPTFHRDPVNLVLHAFAVPAFGLCWLGVIAALIAGHWGGALGGLVGAALAFGVQAYGHGREATPAIPFAGPLDAISRIAVEQSITFYRFVFTGGWLAAWRAAG